MFGKTVCEVPGEEFADALDEAKKAKGATDDLHLDAADLRGPGRSVQAAFSPSTPGMSSRRIRASSCELAMEAVFRSWNAERAVLYRRQERIPADLGTAVNVVAMVFGNLGADSGTGVAFTRDPASGAQGIYGDYLANAQGEDVVAGIRNTVPLEELRTLDHALVRRAAGDHGQARGPLPRSLRHRVHHRARQALDAADPGRQAYGRSRLPDRRAARRRGH